CSGSRRWARSASTTPTPCRRMTASGAPTPPPASPENMVATVCRPSASPAAPASDIPPAGRLARPATDHLMADPSFFPVATSLSFNEVASLCGVNLPEGADPVRRIEGAAPLETAGASDAAYMDNPKYVAALA